MIDHAENIRNTYRKQGAEQVIKELLQKIDSSNLTVDAIRYHLDQLLKAKHG